METVMAVFAHPDDETFICGGTLAKYAAAGHRVVLVCATKGEMGRRMGVPPAATRESIPQVREQELREACDALRISELYLLGLRDKTLEIQPFEQLVQTVYDHMVREQPDTVITFHERLGGHPDHCTIGAAATKAFSRYQQEQAEAKLFFIAWSSMASSPPEYGLVPEQIRQVDISQHLKEKLLAFRAHRTQSQMNEWLWKNDQQSMSKFGSTEYFIQALPPYQPGQRELIG